MIDAGQPFPSFSLQDQNGGTVTLEDLKGSKAIIYFYPKDDTPGCTAEACEFQQSAPDMHKEGSGGLRVIGVSPDSVKSHKKFATKYGLEFTLLADLDHKLCDQLGLWVEKSMYGKKYMGVARTTFVIDENGIVEKVYQGVKPEGHAAQVLAAIQ
ncbi:MAG TPA: thioredoxin-dependent thiol peroxidase [Fimbriimonas sp.]|nr:thioredoxin-dependent thiol peroxidase [Fimbriimonas sp.]